MQPPGLFVPGLGTREERGLFTFAPESEGKQATHTFMMRGRGDDPTPARRPRLVGGERPVCLPRMTGCLVSESRRHLLPSPQDQKKKKKHSEAGLHLSISPQTSTLFFPPFLLSVPLDLIYFFSPFFSALKCRCCVYCTAPARAPACTCALSAPRKVLNGSGHR